MRKFALKPTIPLPPGGILQLATGWDFFGDGWGREPGPDAILQMEKAWRDPEVRRAVWKRTEASHGPHVRPFGHFLFGADGRDDRPLTAGDVRMARARHRAEREAASLPPSR